MTEDVKNICQHIKKNWNITLVFKLLVLSWSTFGSSYSLQSSWVWHNKPCSNVFGNFFPFISAEPLVLCQVAWVLSVDCFQVFPDMFYWVLLWALCGPPEDIYRVAPVSPSCFVLAVGSGSLSCWKVNLQPSLRSWGLSLNHVVIYDLSVFLLHVDPGTPYKDRCVFPNHIRSIEFTTGGFQSRCISKTIKRNERLDIMCHSKGSEYLC